MDSGGAVARQSMYARSSAFASISASLGARDRPLRPERGHAHYLRFRTPLSSLPGQGVPGGRLPHYLGLRNFRMNWSV
jgi:hypothetical protein